MKKIISIFITSVLIISMCTATCYAASNNVSVPPPYTSEELEVVERNKEYFETFSQIQPRLLDYIDLPVPLYAQTPYHCGPTCVQMIVKYKTGIKETLTDIDEEMRFERYPNGPSADAISRTLNAFIGNDSYFHYQLTKGSNKTIELRSWVMDSIRNDLPVVCQISTETLPEYAYADEVYDHYIVVTGFRNGYQGNTSCDNLIYNDPYGLEANVPSYGEFEKEASEIAIAVANNTAGYVVKRKV